MPLGLALVEDHRDEVAELGVGERELVALGTGEEDDAAGLVFDQAAEQFGLFVGELVRRDADVAEEDDVVAGEILEFLGELLDVVDAVAGAELRVEEQAVDIDAGVAGEGVAEEAVFPARAGFR